MRFFRFLSCILAISALFGACRQKNALPVDSIASLSATQCTIMGQSLTEDMMPRSFQDGQIVLSKTHWWCSGFFPGVCWYTYRLGGDPGMKEMALRQTAKLLDVNKLDKSHDLGFQVMPSSTEAYRETGDSLYLKTIYAAAEKLAARFSPVTGVIRSWNGPDSSFIVIIDNMMNLELLTWAARQFDMPEWKEIAITHARTTMRNHFREDGSCYHVVDYNPKDGSVVQRRTVQGYADESAWSRGQAWAVYGFTMMYRETGEEDFLKQAVRCAEYLLPKLKDRPVPAWDFDAPDESIGQDDASAGAIMASAFLELSTLTDNKKLARRCRTQAIATLKALCGKKYLAEPGEMGGFLLKHSTGYYAKGSEVDAPLTYADYYFLEALWRYKRYFALP